MSLRYNLSNILLALNPFVCIPAIALSAVMPFNELLSEVGPQQDERNWESRSLALSNIFFSIALVSDHCKRMEDRHIKVHRMYGHSEEPNRKMTIICMLLKTMLATMILKICSSQCKRVVGPAGGEVTAQWAGAKRKINSWNATLIAFISLDTEMASGRNRLAALIGDDTFQFTFSVPVPKSNPPTYQRSEKPEPSSDNSTPDSSSSQLLFSLIPESHDGDGSDESEVGDEEKRQVEDYSAHHELHAKASPEESTTPADHQPKARSEQVVVRRLRTRSVIVSDNSASNGAQKSSRKNSTAKRNPLQRKRKADPNDENHHHSIAPTTDEDSIPAASTKDHDKVNLIFFFFLLLACDVLYPFTELSHRSHRLRFDDLGNRGMPPSLKDWV